MTKREAMKLVAAILATDCEHHEAIGCGEDDTNVKTQGDKVRLSWAWHTMYLRLMRKVRP